MSNLLAKFKSYKLYLTVAILTGSFIRLWGLDRQGLWFDEVATAVPFLNQFRKQFSFWLFNDFHPPLYYLFLHFWTSIFGTSEAALRFPGAMAGILALFFMYFLTRKILNKHIAVSATILLAFSSAAIVYAQEVRTYSFLLMFSTISTLLWLSLIKKMHTGEAEKRDFFIYGIISLLTMYTHYFGTAFILFQFAYLLLIAFRLKKYLRELFLSIWITCSIFIPWVVYHYSHIKDIQSSIDWIPKSNMHSLIKLIDYIFNKKLIILLFIPFLIIIKNVAKDIPTKIKNIKLDSTVLSLSYLLILPVLTFFIIGRFIPVFFPRYFIMILPPSYLLIAVLITHNKFFSELRGNIYIFTVSLISLILFLFVKGNSIMDFNPFYTPYKQQWRETYQYIARNYTEKDVIYTDRAIEYSAYYFNRFFKGKTIYIGTYNHGSISEADIKKWRVDNINKVFVISNFTKLSEFSEKLLLDECKNLKYQNNNGIMLYECTVNSPNGQ